MLDEIRDHDPEPTDEERRWMAFDAVEAIARVVALGAVALIVGWSTSVILEQAGRDSMAAVGVH